MKFTPSLNQEHFSAIIQITSPWLILKSDYEIVENLKLFPKEMDFNVVDETFNTVLYLAAAHNYIKTIQYLLIDRQVNPNVKVSENSTAVQIAAITGHIEALELLVKRQNNTLSIKNVYGETPLLSALRLTPKDKLLSVVRIIVESLPTSMSIANLEGLLPLELALKNQQIDVIELLLGNNAYISKHCLQSAANLMISCSSLKNTLAEDYSFFASSTEDIELGRRCARAIIEGYITPKSKPRVL